MHHTPPTRLGLLTIALIVWALAGCGGGEPDTPTTPDKPTQPEARPGEVVVEPSVPRVEVDGEQRDTVALVRGLLTDGGVAVPVGYTLEVDDAFAQPGRVRFWVAPAGAVDDEADRAAADAVYGALAEGFKRRMTEALQAQLDEARRYASEAGEDTQALQARLRVFQEARRGLEPTDASRLERRRIDRALEAALGRQIEIDNAVETLQRRSERGRVPELYRIR